MKLSVNDSAAKLNESLFKIQAHLTHEDGSFDETNIDGQIIFDVREVFILMKIGLENLAEIPLEQLIERV